MERWITLTAPFIGLIATIVFTLYLRSAAKKQADFLRLTAEKAEHDKQGAEQHQRELIETRRLIAEVRDGMLDLQSQNRARLPYFDEMQRALADKAHRPHADAQEKDGLLEALETRSISPEQRTRLEEMLQGEIDNPEIQTALSLKVVSTSERVRLQALVDDARMLLAVMPKVVAGQEAEARQIAVEAEDAATMVRRELRDSPSEPMNES